MCVCIYKYTHGCLIFWNKPATSKSDNLWVSKRRPVKPLVIWMVFVFLHFLEHESWLEHLKSWIPRQNCSLQSSYLYVKRTINKSFSHTYIFFLNIFFYFQCKPQNCQENLFKVSALRDPSKCGLGVNYAFSPGLFPTKSACVMTFSVCAFLSKARSARRKCTTQTESLEELPICQVFYQQTCIYHSRAVGW